MRERGRNYIKTKWTETEREREKINVWKISKKEQQVDYVYIVRGKSGTKTIKQKWNNRTLIIRRRAIVFFKYCKHSKEEGLANRKQNTTTKSTTHNYYKPALSIFSLASLSFYHRSVFFPLKTKQTPPIKRKKNLRRHLTMEKSIKRKSKVK